MDIPFSRYLSVRSSYAPSFSPDGRRIAFLSNLTGLPQAWSVPVEGGWPDQLTFGADRVSGVWYSPVDNLILFARDTGGNENAQLFLVNADAANERRLTFDDGAMHVFGAWSRDGRRIAFAANRRDRGRYDLYIQPLDGGKAEIVWQNDRPGALAPLEFSPDGSRLLFRFSYGSFDQDLYELDLDSRAPRLLTPHTGPVRFYESGGATYAPDGRSLYCLSDLDREYAGILRIDLQTLAREWVIAPDCEIDWADLSSEGRRLAWVENHDGASLIGACDLDSHAVRYADQLPTGVVAPLPDFSGLHFSRDGRKLAFGFTTPTRPLDVWVWDLESDRLAPVTRSTRAGIPASALVEPELVHYPTFDGRRIPAWFFRPARGAAPYPVVVWVHGGPEGQTQPMFFAIPQYFLSRGYAVLQPNVRGSTGYGKTYSHLDDVEKRMDSVADLAHAVYWLREQRDVDAARIAVYGGSYGGFMVLSALTTYPELWAAGVDLVGISNFVTFLENTSAYRRSVREVEYGSLERDREFLASISPIHRVDRIRAPLMVIHGANDPRVPLSEAEQMVAALRERNVPVEFLVYPDEGHGLVKLANQLDAFPKVAEFLDRYLHMT